MSTLWGWHFSSCPFFDLEILLPLTASLIPLTHNTYVHYRFELIHAVRTATNSMNDNSSTLLPIHVITASATCWNANDNSLFSDFFQGLSGIAIEIAIMRAKTLNVLIVNDIKLVWYVSWACQNPRLQLHACFCEMFSERQMCQMSILYKLVDNSEVENSLCPIESDHNYVIGSQEETKHWADLNEFNCTGLLYSFSFQDVKLKAISSHHQYRAVSEGKAFGLYRKSCRILAEFLYSQSPWGRCGIMTGFPVRVLLES